MVSRLRVVIAMLLMLGMVSACDQGGGTQPTAGVPTNTAAAPTQGAAATPATTTGGTATTAPSGPTGTAASGQNACTAEAAGAERPSNPVLVIGTGNTGGVFFPYGGGIARVLSAKLPNTQVTAEETGGSVDNMKLILSGNADLGLSTVDSAYDAILGQGAYKDTGPIPACTLAVLYQSFLHVVARDGAGINSVEDMKGKTISVGSAGSSTEGAADRMLEAAGLNPRSDIKRENLSVSDSAAAIKDAKIDAFFWIGGLPTSAVTDLVNTPNIKVKFIQTDKYLEPMRTKYGPVYTPFTLTKNIYAGMEADVPGVGIGNLLFANAKMNEGLAYDIVKTLFDNLADVQTSHPEAKKLSVETAGTGSSIPFHPGAVKFYTEKGTYKP